LFWDGSFLEQDIFLKKNSGKAESFSSASIPWRNGFLYILSKIFSFGLGDLKNTTFEFGTAYIAGAGLLNYLVALDAYDIATGKKK